MGFKEHLLESKDWKIGHGIVDIMDTEYYIVKNVSKKEALEIAYEDSKQDYELYVGSFGIRSVDDIMEEDDVDEDEAYEIFNQEREEWLVYGVEEVK